MKHLILKACLSLSVLFISASIHAGETTNSIGITMVDIPAGSFMMGSCKLTDAMVEENKKRTFLGQEPLTSNCSNPDSDASDYETPQHRVSIKNFQMGKTEVTLGQFKRFITEAGRKDLVTDYFILFNNNNNDDSAPVVEVSWDDAQAFIAWLNKVDGGGYRLPSEAEWEYACRAGGNHTYCGSNDVGAVAWYDANSGNRARTVGGKQANAFGLHDMSGNVWEWTQDCWNDSYNGAPTNGAAWTTGLCGLRVSRGGSWGYVARDSRAASRINGTTDLRGRNVGFRLARTR
jgi:formylglycine-generating enzyme required for sulfatase activity